MTSQPASASSSSTSNLNLAPGVSLSPIQATLTSSILSLFLGHATLPTLRLWDDTAIFEDPLTIANGRAQYEAQWYGLQSAFSSIEQLSHQVTSGGNPIEVDLKMKYTVKGLGKEQTMESKVKIWTDGDKVMRVEDRWGGELKEGAVRDAFRRLNAVTVPKFVGVPKNEEEDAKREHPKN